MITNIEFFHHQRGPPLGKLQREKMGQLCGEIVFSCAMRFLIRYPWKKLLLHPEVKYTVMLKNFTFVVF